MKKTLFTIGSTFIAATTGWAESGQLVSAEHNTQEVVQCESHFDEPNDAGVYGYVITVSPQLLTLAALRSGNTVDDPLIQPLEGVHWATEPAGQLVHSCFEEDTNHNTLEIQVFEDVVIVQRTSLAGLHSPQVFKILRPILNPEPHSRLNGTGSESLTESKLEFDFEKKVKHYVEYGEPVPPELLATLKDQVKHLAQLECRPTGTAHQIGDFGTRSGHQPYMGEFVEISGRFVCVHSEDGSAKIQVFGHASAWNADSGRLFEAAYERMVFNADVACKAEEKAAKIVSQPIYGGDNFSVASVSAWFTCLEST